MSHRGRFVLAAMLSAAVLPLQAADKSKEVIVKGSKLTPAEAASLQDGRTPFSATPEEFLNMAKNGQPACKQGVVVLGFKAGKFTLEDQSYDVDEVISRTKVLKKDGMVSCLWIDSSEYDRASFDALEKTLLDPLKVSLFWPEKDGKQAEPSKAGKR